MPLVEGGNESSAQERDGRPSRRPPHTGHRRQCGTPGAEEQDAQDGIPHDVAGLAYVKVPVFKALPIHAEKKVQDGVENEAGVMGRKECAGFDGDENKPENRRDPGL